MRRFADPFLIGFLVLMVFSSYRAGEFSNPMEWAMNTALILPGIIIGLSFHEFSHAWAAYKLGDITPKMQGRVTINPVAHIDPIGLVALMFAHFGWGRPVEINPINFKHRRRDEFLVAIAGVVMNLLLAAIFTVVLRVFLQMGWATIYTDDMKGAIFTIIFQIIVINLVLMVFNLLPIPPLDGFTIITEIFNLRSTEFYYKVYDKGFIILMILILFGLTSRILTPAVNLMLDLLWRMIM